MIEYSERKITDTAEEDNLNYRRLARMYKINEILTNQVYHLNIYLELLLFMLIPYNHYS